MFTGIIEHCGTITKIEKREKGSLFQITSEFNDLTLGESIAVNGICLTVSHFENNIFFCELSSETLSVTTANKLKKGDRVNLERALRPTDRMGGHIVLGHVDKFSELLEKENLGDCVSLRFGHFHKEELRFLIKKGCIAINGVSLTINDVSDSSFDVMIIPHTLAHTNLSSLNLGDSVNIEFDYLARIIHQSGETYVKTVC